MEVSQAVEARLEAPHHGLLRRRSLAVTAMAMTAKADAIRCTFSQTLLTGCGMLSRAHVANNATIDTPRMATAAKKTVLDSICLAE
jgi:hypothetical protein